MKFFPSLSLRAVKDKGMRKSWKLLAVAFVLPAIFYAVSWFFVGHDSIARIGLYLRLTHWPINEFNNYVLMMLLDFFLTFIMPFVVGLAGLLLARSVRIRYVWNR